MLRHCGKRQCLQLDCNVYAQAVGMRESHGCFSARVAGEQSSPRVVHKEHPAPYREIAGLLTELVDAKLLDPALTQEVWTRVVGAARMSRVHGNEARVFKFRLG